MRLDPVKVLPSYLCVSALDFCNEVIVKVNGKKQSELMPGSQRCSTICPIAETIAKGFIDAGLPLPYIGVTPTHVSIGLEATDSDYYRFPKHERVYYHTTSTVQMFINRFDDVNPYTIKVAK